MDGVTVSTTEEKRSKSADAVYDACIIFFKMCMDIFFREIRSRGGSKIPEDGAIIFVAGPHNNQFLDPIILMSEARKASNRRIAFLIAEASMHRKFVGTAAAAVQSIPVTRSQDIAKSGKGTVFVDSEDPSIVVGVETEFLATFHPKDHVLLGKTYGSSSAEVLEVIDDTHLRLKKEFPKKATKALQEKPEGVAYKCAPYVDQSKMYSTVFTRLKQGGCVGIFPEGGSHDRTDFLPLKAGVSIIALGALAAEKDLKLRIVPVGMNYFHAHKFRSRAVVEFGTPIEVSRDDVELYEKGGEFKKQAIAKTMDSIVNGLKSVTVRAQDFETLMLIQATRRLYRPPGHQLSLSQVVELNKRFIIAYEAYKDEPKVIALRAKVKDYNTNLKYLGLKDHQVETITRPKLRSLLLLLYQLGVLSVWSVLALPGVVLNAPIFIASKVISRKKAKEALAKSSVKIKGNDVLASWKVLIALAVTPALYLIYALGAVILAFRYSLPLWCKMLAPFATLIGLPLIGYSALRFGEVGMDIYKSLRPLFLTLLSGNTKQLEALREKRTNLQADISNVVNEFGPQLFEDFKDSRMFATTPGTPNRRNSYGVNGTNAILAHPMSWVDEYIFGWSQNQRHRASESDGPSGDGTSGSGYQSGYQSGYTTEEPDYDEVIHIVSRDGTDNMPGALRMRPSRSNMRKNRSGFDLTALNAENDSEGARRHSRAGSAFEAHLTMQGLVKRNVESGQE